MGETGVRVNLNLGFNYDEREKERERERDRRDHDTADCEYQERSEKGRWKKTQKVGNEVFRLN